MAAAMVGTGTLVVCDFVHQCVVCFSKVLESPFLQITTQDNTISFSRICLMPTVSNLSSSVEIKPLPIISLCTSLNLGSRCLLVRVRL